MDTSLITFEFVHFTFEFLHIDFISSILNDFNMRPSVYFIIKEIKKKYIMNKIDIIFFIVQIFKQIFNTKGFFYNHNTDVRWSKLLGKKTHKNEHIKKSKFIILIITQTSDFTVIGELL